MPIVKAAASLIEILHRYFERVGNTEDYLQNLTKMENFVIKPTQIMSKQYK